MKKFALLLATIPLLLTVTNVWAQGPFTASMLSDSYDASPDSVSTPNDQSDPGSGTFPGPQQLFNAVNLLTGSSYTKNQDIDFKQYTAPDSIWKDKGNAVFSFVSVTALNSNTLYVYNTATPTILNPILGSFTGFGFSGDGTSVNPFLAATSPFAPGTEFGFTMESLGGYPAGTWDSDPTLNADGLDHMLTYKLTDLIGQTYYTTDEFGNVTARTYTDPYLIGWEDLALSSDSKLGDEDHNDLVFVVDNGAPVAVPEPGTTALFLVGGLVLTFVMMKKKLAIA